jgi:GH15 family glucan-1,4-alpha-glucosidase
MTTADVSSFRPRVAPASTTVRRRYLPGTNVLQTTFVSTAGTVRVTDALVTGIAGRLPWAQLVRRIESLEGEVRMRWAIRPGTRLGTAAPWVVRHDGAHLMRVGATTLAVLGEEIGRARSEQDADPFPLIRGTFLARGGSRHLLAVVATDDEPLHLPDPATLDDSLERSIAGWRTWSREFSYEGPWSDAVQRSALALKLLVYAPTGRSRLPRRRRCRRIRQAGRTGTTATRGCATSPTQPTRSSGSGFVRRPTPRSPGWCGRSARTGPTRT